MELVPQLTKEQQKTTCSSDAAKTTCEDKTTWEEQKDVRSALGLIPKAVDKAETASTTNKQDGISVKDSDRKSRNLSSDTEISDKSLNIKISAESSKKSRESEESEKMNMNKWGLTLTKFKTSISLEPENPGRKRPTSSRNRWKACKPDIKF